MFSVKKKNLLLTFILLVFVIGLSKASAQVQIAPVALYLDENNKTGRIVVRNSTQKPVKLNIEMLFGYPDTDEDGNLFLKIFDEIPEAEPSANQWIRVYPRQLVLPAQEQQTIRFAARPPSQLQAGEYWVRPAISSQNVRQSTLDVDENISANINLIKRTILSINYRHKKVSTGISIDDISIQTERGKAAALIKLNRKGNAAYLGTYTVKIFNTENELVSRQEREVAVYHDQLRKFDLPTSGLSPGNYTAEFTLSTKQRSEENSGILNAPTVSERMMFTLQ